MTAGQCCFLAVTCLLAFQTDRKRTADGMAQSLSLTYSQPQRVITTLSLVFTISLQTEGEWVSWFLTAHEDNYETQCHSRWIFRKIQDSRQIKNTDNTQIKYNPENQTTPNAAKQAILVQSPHMTLGQETRRTHSTMLLSPCSAVCKQTSGNVAGRQCIKVEHFETVYFLKVVHVEHGLYKLHR